MSNKEDYEREKEHRERQTAQQLLPIGSPVFILLWGTPDLPSQALIARSYKALRTAWLLVIHDRCSAYGGPRPKQLFAGVVVEKITENIRTRWEAEQREAQKRRLLGKLDDYVSDALRMDEDLPACVVPCFAALVGNDIDFWNRPRYHSGCVECQGFGWKPIGMTYDEFYEKYKEILEKL